MENVDWITGVIDWFIKITAPVHQNHPVAFLLLLIIIVENLGLLFIFKAIYRSFAEQKKDQLTIIESMNRKSDDITNRLFALIEKYYGSN